MHQLNHMVQKTGDGDLKLIRVGVLGENGLQNRVQAFVRFLLVSCFDGIEQLMLKLLGKMGFEGFFWSRSS